MLTGSYCDDIDARIKKTCLLNCVHACIGSGAIDEELHPFEHRTLGETLEGDTSKSIAIAVSSEGQGQRSPLTASPSLESSTSLKSRCSNACVALTHPTPSVHASSSFTFCGTRKHIAGSAVKKSAKPPVWLSLQPWITPAIRSPLWKAEELGFTTMPEKSQPITFAGGSDIEAFLSIKFQLVWFTHGEGFANSPLGSMRRRLP